MLKGFVIALGAVAVLSACYDPRVDARIALERAGLSDIRMTEPDAPTQTCGADDAFSERFVATAGDGSLVTGVVCSSPLDRRQTIYTEARLSVLPMDIQQR